MDSFQMFYVNNEVAESQPHSWLHVFLPVMFRWKVI